MTKQSQGTVPLQHPYLELYFQEVQKALDLIPLVGSGADIFRTNTFCVFGKYPKKKICDTRFPAVRIAKNSAVKDKPTPIFAKAIFFL